MILPSKYISTPESLLALGAILIEELKTPKTVTELWINVRKIPQMATFQRFALTLTFLFSLGLIDFCEGLLRRCRN